MPRTKIPGRIHWGSTVSLTLDGRSFGPDVGWVVGAADGFPGLVTGYSFIQFPDVTPTGFTIDVLDDGGLAIDFTTT